MKVVIEIYNKSVKIILSDGGTESDFLEFPEENNLSDKLLPEIDRLLRKNMIEAKDIEKMELQTDLSDGFTTYRIAKAVVDGFNWANKK